MQAVATPHHTTLSLNYSIFQSPGEVEGQRPLSLAYLASSCISFGRLMGEKSCVGGCFERKHMTANYMQDLSRRILRTEGFTENRQSGRKGKWGETESKNAKRKNATPRVRALTHTRPRSPDLTPATFCTL